MDVDKNVLLCLFILNDFEFVILLTINDWQDCSKCLRLWLEETKSLSVPFTSFMRENLMKWRLILIEL